MSKSISLGNTATLLALQKIFPDHTIVWENGIDISVDRLDEVNEKPTRLIHFMGHLAGFDERPSIMVTVRVTKDLHTRKWRVTDVTVLCTVGNGPDVRAMEGIDSCTLLSPSKGDLPELSV